jgi:hypothetical protein
MEIKRGAQPPDKILRAVPEPFEHLQTGLSIMRTRKPLKLFGYPIDQKGADLASS